MDNFKCPIDLVCSDAIYQRSTDIELLHLSEHQHPYHGQLIYMIKGTLHVIIGSVDYFLPEGFVGIVPANCLHQLHSRNEMVKMMLVYFPDNRLVSNFQMRNSNTFLIHNFRYISQLPEEIDRKSQAVSYAFVKAFLQVLLEDDNAHYFPLKSIVVPQEKRLESVIQYLNSHFDEEINLSQMAQQFGFTVRNLTRLFKKENISFNNYLNYLRIIHAIELLVNRKDQIEQVGYEVGFKSGSNFSRTFKKFTGVSPSEFISRNILSPTISPRNVKN